MWFACRSPIHYTIWQLGVVEGHKLRLQEKVDKVNWETRLLDKSSLRRRNRIPPAMNHPAANPFRGLGLGYLARRTSLGQQIFKGISFLDALAYRLLSTPTVFSDDYNKLRSTFPKGNYPSIPTIRPSLSFCIIFTVLMHLVTTPHYHGLTIPYNYNSNQVI